MIRNISIGDFMSADEGVPLIDVRTPAEFAQGHIPGAFNLPLFSNEERAQVGTTYKQQGREQAILLGFDLTGSKWSGFIREALRVALGKKVGVHCWRGGMRSGAMAWALSLYGFEVYVVEGGYKQYRNRMHRQFENDYQLVILGGMTGSGKTRILQQLRSAGQQVIDLEGLAQHQGSSYGTMNKLLQPTQEQFENDLAGHLQALDPQQPVWVEDESLTIGKRAIPNAFWHQMRTAPMVEIRVPLEQRIAALVEEYGGLDKDFLEECTLRIRKRLGPEQTKQAIAAIRDGRMAEFIGLVLVYYDKTYRAGVAGRSKDKVFPLDLPQTELTGQVSRLLEFVNENNILTDEYKSG